MTVTYCTSNPDSPARRRSGKSRPRDHFQFRNSDIFAGKTVSRAADGKGGNAEARCQYPADERLRMPRLSTRLLSEIRNGASFDDAFQSKTSRLRTLWKKFREEGQFEGASSVRSPDGDDDCDRYFRCICICSGSSFDVVFSTGRYRRRKEGSAFCPTAKYFGSKFERGEWGRADGSPSFAYGTSAVGSLSTSYLHATRR